MELQSALEQRYSCRAFTDEVPSRDLVEAVLQAGRLAPTACNNQSQRIFVAMGEGPLAKINECTHCNYNFQVAFVIGYDSSVAAVHEPARLGGSEFSFGDQDATSVLVHMALKATDLGLATCWLGAIDDLKLKATLGVADQVVVRAVLVMGYPAENGTPAPLHTKRLPLEETVTWL